jgi:hypothetical protein
VAAAIGTAAASSKVRRGGFGAKESPQPEKHPENHIFYK